MLTILVLADAKEDDALTSEEIVNRINFLIANGGSVKVKELVAAAMTLDDQRENAALSEMPPVGGCQKDVVQHDA